MESSLIRSKNPHASFEMLANIRVHTDSQI